MEKRIISTMIVLLVAIATVTILLQLRNFKYIADLYNEYFETWLSELWARCLVRWSKMRWSVSCACYSRRTMCSG